MVPSMFSNSAMESLERSVEFTTRRHSVLAGNIANMDTPGYQTRDLPVASFQDSLKALSEAKQNLAESGNGPRLFTAGFDEEPQVVDHRQELLDAKDAAVRNVFDSMKQVVYHDGSDDNLEMQVLEISKNQSMHNMSVALLRSQFQTLKVAIAENVNV